jgi:uroporphyrinogen-III decarboxylase
MAAEPDLLADFVQRIGVFLLNLARAEIEAGGGRLSGMYIWGDVAYRNGMLFNPKRWRELFKPHVKALVELFHSYGLMVIYHGCGNATAIFDDMIEIGLDGYNPVEAKADLDVVELKKKYAGRLAFVGNIDVRVLEKGDPDAIRREVSYKLRAARGGGWVFQSDHSISSDVAPESYELAVATLRELGRFPLRA